MDRLFLMLGAMMRSGAKKGKLGFPAEALP
jgi:hypothetical protein